MSFNFKKSILCLVAILCCCLGFTACGDPYANLTVEIDSDNITQDESGFRYVTLDLSSDETATVVLTANLAGLGAGMVDTVSWISSDNTRVVINKTYQTDGVNYVELRGINPTTSGQYVTITACSTEKSTKQDSISVQCVLPPTNASVTNTINSKGIPVGVPFTLNPSDYIDFETANCTIPDYTFEITGFDDVYHSGDQVLIESAPSGGFLTITAYPTNDPDNEDLTVNFTLKTYIPIDETNLEIFNVDTNSIISSNIIELILNGNTAVVDGFTINPNNLTYRVRNPNGSAINFNITAIDNENSATTNVIGNKIRIDYDLDNSQFSITGCESSNCTIYINVSVLGISNSKVVTIPLIVRTVEYPQNIVINAISGSTDYNLTVYDHYKNIQGTLLSVVLAPYNENYCDYDVMVESGTELLNYLDWYIGGSTVATNLTTGGLIFSSGKQIRLKNNGGTGQIVLKITATATIDNPITDELTRKLVINLEYGIRSISVDDEINTLDEDTGHLLMQLNSDNGSTRSIMLSVLPVDASLTGIERATSSDESIFTVMADLDEVGRFNFTAVGVGTAEATFIAKTGVTMTLTVEVFNGLQGYTLGTTLTGQSSRIGAVTYGDVTFDNGEISAKTINEIVVTSTSSVYLYNQAYPSNASILSVTYDASSTTVANVVDLGNRKVETALLETKEVGQVNITMTVYYRQYDNYGQTAISSYSQDFIIVVYKAITSIAVSQETIELLWSGSQGTSTSIYNQEQSKQLVEVYSYPENTTNNTENAVWSIYNEWYYLMGELYDGENYYTANSNNNKLTGSSMTVLFNEACRTITSTTIYAEFNVSVTVYDYQQTFIKTIKVILRQQNPVTKIAINESNQNDVQIINQGTKLLADFDLNKSEQSWAIDATVYPATATNPSLGYLLFDLDENGHPVSRIDTGGSSYYVSPLSSKTAKLALDSTTGLYEIEALRAGRALLLIVPLDIMTEYIQDITNYYSYSYLASNSVIRRIEIYVADGSQENPYELYNSSDVVAMVNTESLNKNFVLMQNIDMASYCKSNPTWSGIGSYSKPFTGTLFSNGYNQYGAEDIDNPAEILSIIGWSINYNDTQAGSKQVPLNFGIFNLIGENAVIGYINFDISNFSITHHNVNDADNRTREYNIGALAGCVAGGTITNVSVNVDNFAYTGTGSAGINGTSIINLGIVGSAILSASADTILNNIATSITANLDYSVVSMNFGAVLGKNAQTNAGAEYIANLSSNSQISIKNATENSNFGMLVGYNMTGATIWGGKASGIIAETLESGESFADLPEINVGGIIGNNFFGYVNDILDSGTQITKRYTLSTVSISANGNIGGIIGLMNGGGVFNARYKILNNATDSIGLMGLGNIGGVIGECSAYSTINYTYAISFNQSRPNILSVGSSNIGGIVGLCYERTRIFNSYSVLNITDTSLSIDTVAGLLVGKIVADDSDISYCYTHGSVNLANSTKCGTLFGYTMGNNLSLSQVYTDAVLGNAGSYKIGENTYTSNYFAWSLPDNTNLPVTLANVIILVPEGTGSDAVFDSGYPINNIGGVHYITDNTPANWASWGFNYTQIYSGGNGTYATDWLIDNTSEKNDGMPYININGYEFIVVSPTSITVNADGMSIYDNTYNGNYLGDIFYGTGENISGTTYFRNIILRYHRGNSQSYQLFGDSTSNALFKISTVPEIDLNDLLIYIVNSNSNVVKVVNGANLTDYLLYVISTGTTRLYIYSAENDAVYDMVQICVVQGYDEVNIYNITKSTTTPIDSGDSFDIQTDCTVQFRVDYLEYDNATQNSIVNVNGGIKILVNGQELINADEDSRITVNNSQWLTDGENYYVLSYNDGIFTLTAINPTEANTPLKISIIPYLEAQFYLGNTLTSEQREIFVGADYFDDSEDCQSNNPQAVISYEVTTYNGVTGIDLDSGNQSMYSGDDLEINAQLYTDNFAGLQGEGEAYSTNSAVGLKIYQNSVSQDDTNLVYAYTVNTNLDTGIKWMAEDASKDAGVFDVNIGAQSSNLTNLIKYPFTINLTDEYKNINTAKTYILVFSFCNLSNLQVTNTYSKSITLTITPQKINGVTIEHFSDVETSGTSAIYLKNAGNLPTNTIIAGEYGLLRVTVVPSYASYDFVEVLSNQAGGDVISFEQRIYNNLDDEYYSYTSGETIVTNGVRLAKASNYIVSGTPTFDGTYYMRTIIASATTKQTLFTVTVNVYKNGSIISTSNQQVSVKLVAPFSVTFDHYNTGTDKAYIARGTGVSGSDTVLSTIKINNRNKVNISYDIASYRNFKCDNKYPISGVAIVLNSGNYYIYVADNVALNSPFTISFSAETYLDGYWRTITRKVNFVVVDYFIDDISAFINNVENGTLSRNYIKSKYYDLNIFGQTNTTISSLTSLNIDTIPDCVSINKNDSIAIESLVDVIKRINGLSGTYYGQAYNTWSYLSGTDIYTLINYTELDDVDKSIDGNFGITINENNGYSITPYKVSSNSKLRASILFTYTLGFFALTTETDVNSVLFECTSDVSVNFYQETSNEQPIPVYTVQEFTSMNTGADYILMNDINLTTAHQVWTPMDIDVASFNGNGYKLMIDSTFDVNNLTLDTYGVFGKVESGTILKNVTVEYIALPEDNAYVNVLNGSYSTLDFGLFAGENNGILTNCAVISSGDASSVEVSANRTSTQTHNIAGFVATNNGNITNSRVENIKLIGDGNVAGFVAINNGSISSSYADSSLTTVSAVSVVKNVATSYVAGLTSTAGFVAFNNAGASVYGCYVGSAYYKNIQGENETLQSNRGLSIESPVYAGGFVYSNSGNISDSYSAVIITNGTNASGFAFINTAGSTINRCYTTSITINVANRTGTPFIGVMGLSATTNNNSGIITNAYYYDFGFPSGSLTYEVAHSLSEEQFNNNNNAYFDSWNSYSFSRTSSEAGQEILGVWTFSSDTNTYFKEYYTSATAPNVSYKYFGPRLVSASLLASFAPWTLNEEETQADVNGVINYVYNIETTDTGYVYDSINHTYTYNPVIISNATEFNYYLAYSTTNSNANSSNYVNYVSARLVDDIALTDLDDNYINLDTLFTEYAGILNGNGFTISGISIGSQDLTINGQENIRNRVTVDNSTVTSAGLFKSLTSYTSGSQTYYGTVKGLTLKIEDISAGQINCVGALAGVINNGYIYNVTVTGAGNRVSGRNFVGGVAGYVTGNTRINDISSNISTTATYSQQTSNVKIYNKDIYRLGGNSNTTDLTQLNEVSYAGGLFGSIDLIPYDNDEIIDLSNFNTVLCAYLTFNGEGSVVGGSVGGIAGMIGGNTILTNSQAYFANTTRLNGLNFVGGLVGHNSGTITYSKTNYYNTVQNAVNIAKTGALVSTASKTIFGTTSPVCAVGGLVGLNFGNTFNAGQTGTIRYCNSSIYVISSTAQNVGGLIGISFGGDIKATYATGTVVGSTTASVGGLIGQVCTITGSGGLESVINFGRNNTTSAIGLANPFGVNYSVLPNQLLTIDFSVAQNNWAYTYYSYYSTILGTNGDGSGYLGGFIGLVSDSTNLSTSHVKDISLINFYNSEITNKEVAITTTTKQSGSLMLNDVGAYINSNNGDFEIATGSVKAEVSGDDNIPITRGYMIKNYALIYGSWDKYSINGYNGDNSPIILKMQAPDSFNITTSADLLKMYWRPDKTYNLMANISLSYINDDNQLSYYPYFIVGSLNQPFTGTFNGNGYTLSNIQLTSVTSHTVGIFGYAKNATIENLNLTNITFATNLNEKAIAYVGGLVGISESSSISKINIQNLVITTDATYVGGIVGYVAGDTAEKVLDNAIVSEVAINYTNNKNPNDNANCYVGGAVGLSSGGIISAISSAGYVCISQVEATKEDSSQNFIHMNIGGSFGGITDGSVVNTIINEMKIVAGVYDSESGLVIYSNYHNYNDLNIGGLAGKITGLGTSISSTFVDGDISASLYLQSSGVVTQIGGISGSFSYATLQNVISAYNIYLNSDSTVPTNVETNVGGCFGYVSNYYLNTTTAQTNYSLTSIFNNSYKAQVNAFAGASDVVIIANKQIPCDTYLSLASINDNYNIGYNSQSSNSAYNAIKTLINNQFNALSADYVTIKSIFSGLFNVIGSKLNPILISTAEEMNNIRLIDSTSYNYYTLTSNIVLDMCGGTIESQPVLLDEATFYGFFNGAGHNITLNSSAQSSTRYGVFGNVAISELGIPSAVAGVYVALASTISSNYNSYSQFGSVVANLGENCITYACGDNGNLTITQNDSSATLVIGGVVGYNEGSVNNCWGGANITLNGTANAYLGGVVGETANSTGGIELSNLDFTGTLRYGGNNSCYIGGILGYGYYNALSSDGGTVNIYKLLCTGSIYSSAVIGNKSAIIGYAMNVSPKFESGMATLNNVEAVYAISCGATEPTISGEIYAIGTNYKSMKEDNEFLEVIGDSGLWQQDSTISYGWPYLKICSGLIASSGSGIQTSPVLIPNEEILGYYLDTGFESGVYYLLNKTEVDGEGHIVYDLTDYIWTAKTLSGYLMIKSTDKGNVYITNVENQLFSNIDLTVTFVDLYNTTTKTHISYDDEDTDIYLTVSTTVTNVLGTTNNGIIHNVQIVNENPASALTLLGGDGYGYGGIVARNSADGSILNCIASDTNIHTNTTNLGSIVAQNSGLISGCNSTNATIIGYTNVGGLVGNNVGNLTNSSINSATISGYSYVGGLVGNATNTSEVSSSNIYDSEINGTSLNIGGAVGANAGTVNIVNTNAGTTISSTNNNVGGIVGNNTGVVSGSKNYSTVTGVNNVGGIVGTSSSTVSSNTNYANLTGENNVGGIVGNSSGSITSCTISSGSITGKMYLGGIVGYNTDGVTDNTCGNANFITTENTQNYIGGIIGYNLSTNISANTITASKLSVGGLGANCIGGLIGYNASGFTNDLTVSNALNFSVGDASNVGLIAGYNASNCVITGSSIALSGNITISSTGSNIGGLVGDNRGTISGIISSYKVFSLSGNTYIGGISGYNAGTISNNTLITNVQGSGNYAGGITGKNDGTISGGTIYCSVQGVDYVGGATGTNYGTINNNLIVQLVYLSGNSYLGGVSGGNVATKVITDCSVNKYSTAISGLATGTHTIVSTGQNIGGIVGYNYAPATLSNCITNDITISAASNYIGGIVGVTRGTIYNCNVYNLEIDGNTSASMGIGGIAGVSYGELDSVTVDGAILNGLSRIGGIVGRLDIYLDLIGAITNYSNVNNITIASSGYYIGAVAGSSKCDINCNVSGTFSLVNSSAAANGGVALIVGYVEGDLSIVTTITATGTASGNKAETYTDNFPYFGQTSNSGTWSGTNWQTHIIINGTLDGVTLDTSGEPDAFSISAS